MSDTGKVLSLRKALTSSVAAGKVEEIKSILQQLKTDVKATEELLRETKIGLSVGKLRSNENKEVAALAKELVKKWKEDVSSKPSAKGESKEAKSESSAPSKPSPSTTNGPTPSNKPPSTSNGTASASSSSTNKASASPAPAATAASPSLPPNGQPRTTKTDGVNSAVTEDKTRNKCIELVYDSLAMDSGAESKLILKRAIEIEAATYRNLKDPAQYRTKMRSLYLNLKDKSNPELRAGVISGEMDGTLLWNMSPQDMASAEKKAELAAMTKEALLNAQGAAPKKSETDMFECGKCRKRRCTYYQMQTRSADEPMTTFVTCLECGNNWRFS